MNLDDLISKYLDGELKDHEDSELRKLISEDEGARSDFDSAVILNAACREDAKSISAPRSFLEETESKILMKIMAEKPLINETPVYKPDWMGQFARAAVIAFVMLIGVFKISDLSLRNYQPMLFSMMEEEKARIEKEMGSQSESVTSKNFKNNKLRLNVNSLKNTDRINKKNQSSENSFAFVSSSGSGSAGPKAESVAYKVKSDDIPVSAFNDLKPSVNVSIAPQTANNPAAAIEPENSNAVIESKVNDIQSDSKVNEDIDYKSLTLKESSSSVSGTAKSVFSASENLISNGTTLTAVSSKPINYKFSDLDFYKSHTDVQLSSFFGTDLARMDLNVDKDDAISHFSQSLAYPIDKSNIIGVEMGYTSYSYSDNMVVGTHLSGDNGMLESIEVTNPGDEDKTIVYLPVTFKRNKQIVWASAFYERNLIELGDFSVRGRIGGGASSDGLLSFGRVFGRYQIIPGLSFTVGADGRLFKAKLTRNDFTSESWRGTVSLIYGFQFSF